MDTRTFQQRSANWSAKQLTTNNLVLQTFLHLSPTAHNAEHKDEHHVHLQLPSHPDSAKRYAGLKATRLGPSYVAIAADEASSRSA